MLATIQFDYRKINVHMPVDGKIIKLNDVNLLVDQNLLLTHTETEGWLAKIRIYQPLQKEGLLSFEQYMANSKA